MTYDAIFAPRLSDVNIEVCRKALNTQVEDTLGLTSY
jgi:hypothetical protein